VDVAMYDGILAFCERIVPQYSYTGEVPALEGNAHPSLCPFGIFPASDGHVSIACPGDSFWAILCNEMERPELIEDERFLHNYNRVQHMDATLGIISEWSRGFSKHELMEKLGGKIPFGPVQDAQDLFADPHVEARHMLSDLDHPRANRKYKVTNTPIKMTRTQGGVRSRAPLLGEHSESILRQFGFDDGEIRDLVAANVVQQYSQDK